MALPLLTQPRSMLISMPLSGSRLSHPTLSTKLLFCLPSQFRSQSRAMSVRGRQSVSHYGVPRSLAQVQ